MEVLESHHGSCPTLDGHGAPQLRSRARSVGFVYSWSRFSAIFTGFMIAAILKNFGVTGVFIFISIAMAIPMLAIGLLGSRTKNIALEEISNQ